MVLTSTAPFHDGARCEVERAVEDHPAEVSLVNQLLPQLPEEARPEPQPYLKPFYSRTAAVL